MRWRKFLVVPTMLSLAACNPETSDVVGAVVCPAIASYQRSTLDRALAEYKALPSGSALKQLIGDYGQLRDQVRACREGGHHP